MVLHEPPGAVPAANRACGRAARQRRLSGRQQEVWRCAGRLRDILCPACAAAVTILAGFLMPLSSSRGARAPGSP